MIKYVIFNNLLICILLNEVYLRERAFFRILSSWFSLLNNIFKEKIDFD